MTPLADVLENETVRKEFPSLVQAIEGIGSPQIINMGTIGGDLCQRPRCWYYRQGFGLLGQHAIFGNTGPAYFVNPSSLAPALIALGTTLEIAGPSSKTRQVGVAEFFRTPRSADERENVLAPNELISQIMIPAKGLANATYEVRPRQGLDWPLVAAAVSLPRNGSGKAEIVLGHVAPVPWRVSKAAAVLAAGQIPNEELAARAGDVAAEGATPLSGNAYKVRLVKTAVKRAILAAAEKMRA
jgi:xanthine dehydrogenase YagS FAD-binding subunit